VVEEAPPEAGVDGVPPTPVELPPTDGVVPGLGVGRSEGVGGIPAPGAAGVPGFAPMPDADLGCDVGTRLGAS
jgi:hypothetical protein